MKPEEIEGIHLAVRVAALRELAAEHHERISALELRADIEATAKAWWRSAYNEDPSPPDEDWTSLLVAFESVRRAAVRATAEAQPEVFREIACKSGEHARCESYICGCACHEFKQAQTPAPASASASFVAGDEVTIPGRIIERDPDDGAFRVRFAARGSDQFHMWFDATHLERRRASQPAAASPPFDEVWISFDAQETARGIFHTELACLEDAATYGQSWVVRGPFVRRSAPPAEERTHERCPECGEGHLAGCPHWGARVTSDHTKGRASASASPPLDAAGPGTDWRAVAVSRADEITCSNCGVTHNGEDDTPGVCCHVPVSA